MLLIICQLSERAAMAKKYQVEALVNGNPIIPTSTDFQTYEAAETYAKSLCAEQEMFTAYRVCEAGWGAPRKTLNFPSWINAKTGETEVIR
jgi:hypothetical protein